MSETLPPLILTRPGIYRHYKNLLYEVKATVRHSESLEPMTLYQALYGDRGLWVRPAAMFNDSVERSTACCNPGSPGCRMRPPLLHHTQLARLNQSSIARG